MLHTVNKSPFEKDSLESCLATAKAGSAVLLIEDGVYAALEGSKVADKVKAAMSADIKVYALGSDLDTRGVAGKVMGGIKIVGYDGFVDLACEHDKVSSWL